MPEKVLLSKIRTTGQAVDDSILLIKQNWKPLLKSYFTICGLFWLAGLAVSTINQIHMVAVKESGESIFTAAYFLTIAVEFVNFTLLIITGLSFMAIYREKEHEAPTVIEVWGYVKFYFFRIFGSVLLLTIMVAVAFVCCIFPGFYFGPIFTMVITIMILENTSFGYAFNRSFRLISNKWGYIFGIIMYSALTIFIASLLVTIPAAIIASIFVFAIGTKAYSTYMIAVTVSSHLTQFLYLLPIIAVGLGYFNLVEQKEDHTLLERINMLGKDEPQTDQPSIEEEY